MTSRDARPALRPTTDLARTISYSPDLDGDADPGEIVWTWVAYEDDPNQPYRALIVFGQGAVRCHPHVLDEMAAVQANDESALGKALMAHGGDNPVRTVRGTGYSLG